MRIEQQRGADGGERTGIVRPERSLGDLTLVLAALSLLRFAWSARLADAPAAARPAAGA